MRIAVTRTLGSMSPIISFFGKIIDSIFGSATSASLPAKGITRRAESRMLGSGSFNLSIHCLRVSPLYVVDSVDEVGAVLSTLSAGFLSILSACFLSIPLGGGWDNTATANTKSESKADTIQRITSPRGNSPRNLQYTIFRGANTRRLPTKRKSRLRRIGLFVANGLAA